MQTPTEGTDTNRHISARWNGASQKVSILLEGPGSLKVEREVSVMVYYRGEPLARQTFDMVVNERVIVENKTGERLASTAKDQLFSYLSSTNIEVGLVLHFGRKPTFRRVICENRFKLHGPIDGQIRRRPSDPKSR